MATTTSPALDRFFETLRRSTVTRSNNRVIAGVCGGIAERFGLSAAIVRVAAVALVFFGPGLVLYFVAWLLLPAADGSIRLERALRQGDGGSIFLLVVTALAVIPDAVWNPHFGWFPLVLLGAIAYLVYRNHACRGQRQPHVEQSSDPAQPPSPWSTGPGGQPQDAPRA
jgi:phage shock protein PspC (stress-responsive transcriptional regulator)